jgi:hypothetical protein
MPLPRPSELAMAISMYQASVPLFLRTLGALRNILEKAQAHAEMRKFDPAALIGARLFPDMFALARQVQIATDMAKGCGARLAGIEPPRYEDNESTFPELLARIDKTVAFLKSLKAEQIDGSEGRDVTLQMRSGAQQFKGLPYLQFFALPNFYFHATTAYNILRHSGVELGKMDFIGPA